MVYMVNMKDITVEELIEILKQKDPKAIVCGFELEDDKPIFSSIEICKECRNDTYINNSGDEIEGNVVAIY